MQLRQRRGVATTTIVIVVIAVVIVGGVGLYFALTPSSPSNVTFELNFSPQPYHAFAYYGVSQNIYKDHGFDVTIQPGQNDGAAIAAVSAGTVQFGLTDTSNLIATMSTTNITNVRIVAIIMHTNIYAVIYNEAVISSISDLNGKSAGSSPANNGGIAVPLFDIFAQKNGVNLSSIQFTYGAAPVHNALLVSGKVDFVVAAMNNLPQLQPAANSNGIHLGAFSFGENGVPTYGVALITSTEMIQQHSAEVQAFVTATMQSLQDSLQNPTAATAALEASQPQLNATQSLQAFQLLDGCCFTQMTGITNPLQLGWINATRMQQGYNLVVTGLNLTNPVSMSNLYTDAYVEAPSG